MPAAAAKVLHVLQCQAKVEATQNTAIALTPAQDGLQLYYKDKKGAKLSYKYLYDGDMGPNVGSLGRAKRVTPSGIEITGGLPFVFRGSGAAYSASVVPSFHTWLKASGYTAVVDITGGAEKWTYTPTVAGSTVSTLTMELYERGMKYAAAGVMGSVKVDAPDLAPPIWMFDVHGIGTLPTDSAAITPTYPNSSVAPPLGGTFTLTLGSLGANAVVRKWGFDLRREVVPRLNQSATGTHAGFAPGDRFPVMTVTLEATALATTPFTSATAIDAAQLRDVGTSLAAVLQLGSAQYNRCKINFAQAQVIDWADSDDNGVATIDLTIAGYNSTPTAPDDHTIVCD
jgi:hypothetical protein